VILNRENIDTDKWNNCVKNSSQANIYGLSWYLDIALQKNWEGLVFEQNDMYQVVVPIPIQYKYGFKILPRPVLCQTLGVFSREDSPNVYLNLVQEITKKYLIIAGYPLNTYIENALINYTHHLTLDKKYTELFKNYKPSRRNKLRKAQKYAWKIIASDDIETLIEIFKNNHEQQINGFKSSVYRILEALFQKAFQKNMVVLYLATSPETKNVEAGILCWKFKKKLIYQFCAATELGTKQEARTFLIDNLIQKYAETNFVLDFESTNIESFMAWNASFGAVAVPFSIIEKNTWLIKLKHFFCG
jgi:Acetyltransferase (GNAT) domain